MRLQGGQPVALASRGDGGRGRNRLSSQNVVGRWCLCDTKVFRVIFMRALCRSATRSISQTRFLNRISGIIT